MRGGAAQNHLIFQQFKYTLHIFLEIRIITFFWKLLAENYYCKTRTCFWALLLGRHIYPAFIVMSQSFMLYCTHIQPSATGINICNTAQLIKSQTAFLFFFCKTHIGESGRGGNVHAVTIKRREIWLTTYLFSAPLYPYLQETQSGTLPIHNQFVLFPPLLPQQYKHFLTRTPVTTWSNQVSLCTFPITSCLTDGLQRDSVSLTQSGAGLWLGMPKHTGLLGAVGCSSQSETMLTDLFFPHEASLVLLVSWKLPQAGNAPVPSFFSTGSIFPQGFVRTSVANVPAVLTQTHLWKAPVFAKRALWSCYLNPSSFQGINGHVSFHIVLPSTACLSLSPTLWGKPCLHFTHFSEVSRRKEYCLLQYENTTKLLILFT